MPYILSPAILPACPGPPRLQSASFTAPRISVRPGLGSLPSLLDLRFRSAKKPLTLAPSHTPGSPAPSPPSAAGAASLAGAPLLPAQLLKLRLEGCHLTEVSQ